jgi:hypothetical protein
MSMTGSYQFFQTGNWMLFPRKIVVYLHDTMETTDIARGDVDELRQRVQDIIAGRVEAELAQNPVEKI